MKLPLRHFRFFVGLPLIGRDEPAVSVSGTKPKAPHGHTTTATMATQSSQYADPAALWTHFVPAPLWPMKHQPNNRLGLIRASA
jgi:hypothetical protein